MNRTKITREEAITISIELWTELAETGGDGFAKDAWPGWAKYGGSMLASCAMCQYDYDQDGDCGACPYHQKYGACLETDHGSTVLDKWANAETPRTRKKYARLGVEQLKALLEE